MHKYYMQLTNIHILRECGLVVRQEFTTGVSLRSTVLGRTCQKTCYWHWAKRMPTCISARKNYALVRTNFYV